MTMVFQNSRDQFSSYFKDLVGEKLTIFLPFTLCPKRVWVLCLDQKWLHVTFIPLTPILSNKTTGSWNVYKLDTLSSNLMHRILMNYLSEIQTWWQFRDTFSNMIVSAWVWACEHARMWMLCVCVCVCVCGVYVHVCMCAPKKCVYDHAVPGIMITQLLGVLHCLPYIHAGASLSWELPPWLSDYEHGQCSAGGVALLGLWGQIPLKPKNDLGIWNTFHGPVAHVQLEICLYIMISITKKVCVNTYTRACVPVRGKYSAFHPQPRGISLILLHHGEP